MAIYVSGKQAAKLLGREKAPVAPRQRREGAGPQSGAKTTQRPAEARVARPGASLPIGRDGDIPDSRLNEIVEPYIVAGWSLRQTPCGHEAKHWATGETRGPCATLRALLMEITL